MIRGAFNTKEYSLQQTNPGELDVPVDVYVGVQPHPRPASPKARLRHQLDPALISKKFLTVFSKVTHCNWGKQLLFIVSSSVALSEKEVP